VWEKGPPRDLFASPKTPELEGFIQAVIEPNELGYENEQATHRLHRRRPHGHGAAKNILERGYPLTVMGHRNRAPVDDLVAKGAKEASTPAAVAAASDILFMCLPSSVEVEHTSTARTVCSAGDARRSSSSWTRRPRIRAARSASAPISRRAACAWRMARSAARRRKRRQGKLSTFLGGDPTSCATIRPIVECYADTIIEAGALGAGHTLKLMNNFISIGTCAVISEALATAAKLGVDMKKLYDVVSAGGANSKMFQMVMPWVLEGDDSHLKGRCASRARTCASTPKLAESAPATAFIAQAVNQTYQLANIMGHGERFMPTLPGILAELNGCKIRDL
jgi:3-hydroxyisobutyrate dehydrogenase-like beta-hydroxyacid dehydrogenase